MSSVISYKLASSNSVNSIFSFFKKTEISFPKSPAFSLKELAMIRHFFMAKKTIPLQSEPHLFVPVEDTMETMRSATKVNSRRCIQKQALPA